MTAALFVCTLAHVAGCKSLDPHASLAAHRRSAVFIRFAAERFSCTREGLTQTDSGIPT